MYGGDPFQVPGGMNYGQQPAKNPMMGYPTQPGYGQMGGAPAGWAGQGAMPIMQPPVAGMNPNMYQMQQLQMQQAAAGVGWNAQGVAPYAPGGGLQYLSQIDQLLVKQKVELLEAFTGFETSNKYAVMNSAGQKIFFAAEDSDCCTRMCCGPVRSFDMKIFDMNRQEILSFHRPLRCSSCCCFCCLQEMEVYATPGTLLGSVVQDWSIFKPSFSIKDAAGMTMLTISGPFCTWSLCGDVEFQVYSALTGEEVGKISKKWTGFAKEAFTDADNFGVNFPFDLDVKIKAVLLAALFLIDFMFFEDSGDKTNDSPGMW